MNLKKILWPFFVFFSLGVGLYPFLYFVVDMTEGLLALKDYEQLSSLIWSFAFYTHIITGGIALITGWSQFSKKIRSKNLRFHRILGKVYLIAVLISGLSGLYIAIYASGGLMAKLGFGTLAILWLFSAWKAYTAIKRKDIQQHQNWMIRNYALSWAGVMLRIWLPLLNFGFGFDFFMTYPVVAWLSWVPNLLVAQGIINTLPKSVNLI